MGQIVKNVNNSTKKFKRNVNGNDVLTVEVIHHSIHKPAITSNILQSKTFPVVFRPRPITAVAKSVARMFVILYAFYYK